MSSQLDPGLLEALNQLYVRRLRAVPGSTEGHVNSALGNYIGLAMTG